MTTETKSMIIVGIISIAILFGGAWLYQKNTPKDELLANQDALVRGNSMKVEATNEKLVVVEFGDYQCPACGYIAPSMKELQEKYKDSVTFVFRDFPLNIHANALKASQLSYIANEQGKYWEMHEKLYNLQTEWEKVPDPIDIFVSYAKALNMNIEDTKKKLSSDIYVDRIKADIKDASLLGINSTPTFFVGNTIIRSANAEAIKKAIDVELAKVK